MAIAGNRLLCAGIQALDRKITQFNRATLQPPARSGQQGLTVWLYHMFGLKLPDVQILMAERTFYCAGNMASILMLHTP
ncbi:MAG: hypothetical protein ACRYFY_00080 [Janthinobacterium lividum]